MKKNSRETFYSLLSEWYQAWNDHNFEAVLNLFHDEIIFEDWNGHNIKGKRSLRRAWKNWFKNHGDFIFQEEETIIDEESQKVTFSWKLTWPSRFGGKNQKETISGVDILHFYQGKIIRKNTFSKLFINIEKKKIHLKTLSTIPSSKKS